MVWCDRGLYGRLGRHQQVLSDQQHQRCMGWFLFREYGEMGSRAGSPEDPVQAGDGFIALLPPALVLVGRGSLSHHWREAGTDDYSGIGMEADRRCCTGILGRHRTEER